MVKTSAGILLFRRPADVVEVFLAHPGGPYWAKKDDHAWSIPKGEFDSATEDAFVAATREFAEETGGRVSGPHRPLSPLKQAGGKVVHAFAVEQDFDPAQFTSNTFSLEWPPRSGRHQDFPEIDRVAWFPLAQARTKLLAGQIGFLDQLSDFLATDPMA